MSFYSGSRNAFCPGPINNNPINGLCEKACINVKKVFDACLRQITETDISVTITDNDPTDPTDPLTFVSAVAQTSEVTVTDVVVDRFSDKPCFARVTCTVNIPLEVNYTDADGTAGVGDTSLAISTDVVLYVPQPSIVPFEIEAFANCVTTDGDYVGSNEFTLDCCISIILRVVLQADLLVPTYGYCPIPPCTEYSTDACSGYFELPIYPAQQAVVNAL